MLVEIEMKNYRHYILILGLFSSQFGCVDKRNKDDKLIEITSRTEDGFQDIILKITESSQSDNGEFEIIAKGKSDEKTVGLKVVISEKSKKVTFSSLGLESDNFIGALSRLYSLPTDKKFIKNTLPFDLILMSKEENKEYYLFKIFFDPYDSAGLYSELYLNVNLTDNEIELKEKDEEYRKNLIEALSE
jgi:hypothetical protein